MDRTNDNTGAEMPTQDRVLAALADLLEEIGDEAGQAWLRNGAGDETAFTDCTKRAEVVVKAIVGLRAVSLHGASAKARAVKSGAGLALLPRKMIDALGLDMAADMTRLCAPMEAAGHA